MSGDMTLTCRDCGQGFTFTSGEQDFYASRGFSEPTRCADCRAARRTERDRGSYSRGGGGGYDSAPPGARPVYERGWPGGGKICKVPLPPRADQPRDFSAFFEHSKRPRGPGG